MKSGAIFRQTWREMRWRILGWGSVATLHATLIVTFYANRGAIISLMESVFRNPVVEAVLGKMEFDFALFTSPEAFVGLFFFTDVPLVLSIFVLPAALNITAGEEERGTLDLLLSCPVPRWRVVVEKFAALGAALLPILGMVWLTLFALRLLVPDLLIPPGRLTEGVINVLPLMLCLAALTLAISTVTRTRGRAAAGSVAVLVASYLSYVTPVFMLLPEPLNRARYLFPYWLYNSTSVLMKGINWGNAAVLCVLTIALVALAVWRFERRDILR